MFSSGEISHLHLYLILLLLYIFKSESILITYVILCRERKKPLKTVSFLQFSCCGGTILFCINWDNAVKKKTVIYIISNLNIFLVLTAKYIRTSKSG